MHIGQGKVRDENIKKAFIQYLEEHPQERLFQSIRNFSGYPFIAAMYHVPRPDQGAFDTFYLEEGRDTISSHWKEYVDGIEEGIVIT